MKMGAGDVVMKKDSGEAVMKSGSESSDGLYAIKDRIVSDSFPELKDDSISICFDPSFRDGLLEFDMVKKGHFTIKVNTVMKKASLMAVEGAVAHELSHIVSEKKMGRLSSFLDGFLYRHVKRYRKLDERSADLSALMRGYGPHLAELCCFRRGQGLCEYDDNGLTKIEIDLILSGKSVYASSRAGRMRERKMRDKLSHVRGARRHKNINI